MNLSSQQTQFTVYLSKITASAGKETLAVQLPCSNFCMREKRGCSESRFYVHCISLRKNRHWWWKWRTSTGWDCLDVLWNSHNLIKSNVWKSVMRVGICTSCSAWAMEPASSKATSLLTSLSNPLAFHLLRYAFKPLKNTSHIYSVNDMF